ncbi:MAG: hypothetical protein ACRDQW_12900 [Haloechinothrix sp.]
MKLSPLTLRRAATLWGLLRVGLGVTAVLAPKKSAAVWTGEVHPEEAGAVLGRALGGRDASLGAGMVASAAGGHAMRPWILAGGGADAMDALATLAAWDHLPRGRRELVLVASAGSALFAGALAYLET